MMTDDRNATIEGALSWRYATKRFDASRRISEKDWSTLEQCLRMSPSSFGLQPWHFVVVKDPETRKRLQPHSWNQPQIVEASHLVVLAARRSIDERFVDSHLSNIANTRGVAVETLAPYRQLIVTFVEELTQRGEIEHWATRQVYLALGFLLSNAPLLGIDACPIEGLEPAMYDDILDLPSEGYATKVACALGYRSAEDQYAHAKKVRYTRDEVISFR